MTAYHNMSCPPRSNINKVVQAVGEQIVFNFKHINLHIPDDKSFMPDAMRNALIKKWLESYMRKHSAELDAISRPTGYMIGTPIDLTQNSGKYHICRDPLLTVAIIGRISGMIYIPRREISLTCHTPGFDTPIAFPQKYFSQINDLKAQP